MTDNDTSGNHALPLGHNISVVDQAGPKGVFVDWKIIVGMVSLLGVGGVGGVTLGHGELPKATVETLATKENVAQLTAKIDNINQQLGTMALAQNTAAANTQTITSTIADHEQRLRAIERRLK